MESSAVPTPLFAAVRDTDASPCETLSEPLSQVMTLLGKRWTGVVWGTLMQGPVYFSDLKRSIPGINDRILNERLVELVALGLATRTVIDDRPIRVRYALTERGSAIRPALDELARWAVEHLR
ncbi:MULTISPECIES: winged helix-turn-helix transcriptional regulator [Catenuloplanes]|uniref:DNA-binding HxlR family transcriptional regulator n=1 Tax=Catenuloplanes niger TaxID=587534 RepID=A0AAE3ZL69_9ACTN|nr:helix-turn-helix domain-containing protein [Catenuloplanes niger]MDR7320660.1 DNA-binding HxlR family transcriptional regulator [Catenuloplanes niger]